MRKGQMLDTKTEVLDTFDAQVGDKYYGDVSLFHTDIIDIYSIYTIEYSMRSTGMGIDHKVFDREEDARACYDELVRKLKDDIIKALQKEVA